MSDDIVGILKEFYFKGGSESINLGHGILMKMINFFTILKNLSGKTAKIEYIGRQLGDVKITYADISKAQKKLGFKPRIGIEKGLENFFNWFNRHYALI